MKTLPVVPITCLKQSDGFVVDGDPGVAVVRLNRRAHLLQNLVFDFNWAGDHQFKVLHLVATPSLVRACLGEDCIERADSGEITNRLPREEGRLRSKSNEALDGQKAAHLPDTQERVPTSLT